MAGRVGARVPGQPSRGALRPPSSVWQEAGTRLGFPGARAGAPAEMGRVCQTWCFFSVVCESFVAALNRPAAQRSRLPADHPPLLLVVIDTEEEFDWRLPHSRENTAVSAMEIGRASCRERVCQYV